MFSGLAAGTYTITETQPAGYTDGKDTIGTQGGTVGADTFTGIVLSGGVSGSNYNFGEHAPPVTTIKVVKTSTTTLITNPGQVVPYTFTVTNTGNTTLTGIKVTDPKCSTPVTRTGGDTNGDNKLQTTETWTYTCNHTVTQAEFVPGGSLTNTVTADSTESAPATSTLVIPITSNHPPAATDDSYSTKKNTALTVAAPGILGNDTDADFNALTAVLVTNVSKGTLVLNANGSFTYTPAKDFTGNVTFTYQAYDGTSYSNVATVTINVTR